MNNEVKIEIFKKAALSRIFEECVFNYIKQAKFKCPIYLSAGQEFIPVHIYPVKFNQKKSEEYLQEAIKNNPSLEKFSSSMKQVFDYFEGKKNLPILLVTGQGEYLVN